MTKEKLFSLEGRPVSEEIYGDIKDRLDKLPKPVNGCGRFEDIICRIGQAQGSRTPNIYKKALVVMSADNGIIEEGISQAGGYYTKVETENMAKGVSSVSIMASSIGMKVVPVDIGINGDVDTECGVISAKVCNGTKNFLKDPAMTEQEALKAIETGISLVKELKSEGYGIICAGEMGVGSSTTAVALICAILDGDPSMLTGRGNGLSDRALDRKIDVISEAMHIYGYDRDDVLYSSVLDSDFDKAVTHEKERIFGMICNVGGLDIAGLVGLFIGGAIEGVPIVIDGIVSAAAALAAESLMPGCKKYMIASHFGQEPATELVFDHLEFKPVIQADISMGQGAGSVMIMPIIDMVIKMYDELEASENPYECE